MALTCQFQLSFPGFPSSSALPQTYSATSPPTLSLTISNPGTTSVSVTGVDVVFSDRSMNGRPASTPLPLPMAQGQSNSIAGGASTTFGPFPLSTWTTATPNPAALIVPDSSPFGALPAFPMFEVFVAGMVYGSDGSANPIGKARMMVGYPNQPGRAFVGGNADFGGPGDSPILSVVA